MCLINAFDCSTTYLASSALVFYSVSVIQKHHINDTSSTSPLSSQHDTSMSDRLILTTCFVKYKRIQSESRRNFRRGIVRMRERENDRERQCTV